jgi:YHS domain-containing protein
VLIYRKYYGGKVTALIVAIMFSTMVAAALIVDGIFSALGLVPTRRPSIESISERAITWNYTTALNIVFTAVAAALFALTMRRGARDPVCGMTVDRTKGLRRDTGGRTYFFCGPGCLAKFEAREGVREGAAAAEPEAAAGPEAGAAS